MLGWLLLIGVILFGIVMIAFLICAMILNKNDFRR